MPDLINSTSPHNNWRLPAHIVDLISAEMRQPVPDDVGRVALHLMLQKRLRALGNRLGYGARLEHRTPRILNGRFGFVDVVWDAPEGGRSVAIEIDRSWRKKSVTKLTYMADTHQPVWVFIGHLPMPFTPDECDFGRIHLIQGRCDLIERARVSAVSRQAISARRSTGSEPASARTSRTC